MKKFYILALVAAMFAACATDTTEDVAIGVPETLRVSFEDEDSRIQLANGKTVWTKGDQVSVFYRSNANQKWQYKGETGERVGELQQVDAGSATREMDRVVVVYPYNESYYINPSTCNVQASLPAVQTYLADSYGLNGNIMISHGEYNNISLKSVCGWLKLQLTGNGEKVQTITLKGNNGEQVAGEIYINSADATAILSSDAGDADDSEIGGAGGNLLFENTILNEVTLNCGEGVTLGADPTAFYIALPPQEFSKGVTLKVFYADGTTMTKSTSNSIEIARNTILPMSTLYYDGNVPPVYELAYTTNDGEPLDPFTTEGFGANFVENIFDPATGKGALKFDGRVTTIPARAFVACTNLTQIELTKDITTINAEAFSGCKVLAMMNIPQGVETIGDKAFYNCGGTTTEITIPSSVTSIGTSSFEGCGGKANINCEIYSSGFEKAKFTKVVIGNSVTSIGHRAFYYCTSLTSVTIPDGVTEIGSDAFYHCTSLTSVTIPDRVTSIGGWAFNECTSLKEVYYNGDLSAWCKINFYDHSANPMCNGAKLYLNGVELTEVTIPSNMTEIKYVFTGCASLKSITFHKRVTSIGDYAFYNCSSLTSITIPNSVTSIGDGAFRDCTGLTSITIPDSVTEIRYATFDGCISLTSVTIPDSVTSIGVWAFSYCTSLVSVTIPDSVTSIGDYEFYNCSSLTNVTIPDSVTSIGVHAFSYCTSLKDIYCKPTTPPNGSSSMFSNNPSVPKIYVPRASVDAYKAASYWSNYKSYIEPYDFE